MMMTGAQTSWWYMLTMLPRGWRRVAMQTHRNNIMTLSSTASASSSVVPCSTTMHEYTYKQLGYSSITVFSSWPDRHNPQSCCLP